MSSIAYLLPPFFHLMIIFSYRAEISAENESCRYSMIYIKELEKPLIILPKCRTKMTPNICKNISGYGCSILPLKYYNRQNIFSKCLIHDSTYGLSCEQSSMFSNSRHVWTKLSSWCSHGVVNGDYRWMSDCR